MVPLGTDLAAPVLLNEATIGIRVTFAISMHQIRKNPHQFLSRRKKPKHERYQRSARQQDYYRVGREIFKLRNELPHGVTPPPSQSAKPTPWRKLPRPREAPARHALKSSDSLLMRLLL